MTAEVFVNVGEATLAVAALSTDPTLTLLSGAPYPAAGQYRIRLDDSRQQPNGIATRYQISRATFNAGNTINIFTTSADLEGTTAQGWPIGTAVRAILTAAALKTYTSGGPYKAKARNSSSTIYNGTFTKIALTSVDYDPNSNFASSRYTAPVAGYYDIRARLQASTYAVAGDVLLCGIFKNGAEIDRAATGAITQAGLALVASGIYPLAAGDYIELWGQVGAGSNATNSWINALQYSSLTVAYHSSC